MTNYRYTHTALHPNHLHANTPEAQQRMQNTVKKLQYQKVASLVMQCASMASQLYLLSPLSRKPLPAEPNHAMWSTIAMTQADADQYFADEDAYKKVQVHNASLDAHLPEYFAHLLTSLINVVQHTTTLFRLNQIDVLPQSRPASQFDTSMISLRNLITPISNYQGILEKIKLAVPIATLMLPIANHKVFKQSDSFSGIQNASPLLMLAKLPNVLDTLASMLSPVCFFNEADIPNIAQAEPRRDEVLRPHAPR